MDRQGTDDLLQSFLANLPGGVARIRFDERFTILYASQAFYHISGRTKEEYDAEFQGACAPALLQEDVTRLRKELPRLVQQAGVMAFDVRMHKKGGGVVWVHALANCDPDSVENAFDMIFTDITDMQQEKRKNEKINQERNFLWDGLPGGIAVIALQRQPTVKIANQYFYTVLGYTEQEFFASPISGRIGEILLSIDARTGMQYAFLREIGATDLVRCRLRRKDGAYERMLMQYRVMDFDEDGVPMVLALFISTTAQYEAEQTARSARRQLESLMNAVPGGAAQLVIGKKVELCYANRHFFEIFGYSEEEFRQLMEKDPLYFVVDADRAALHETVKKQFSQGQKLQAQFSIMRRDGQARWVSLNGDTALDEKRGMTFQCILMDITELKQAQADLEYQRERDRILLECANNYVYDYDIKNDLLRVSHPHGANRIDSAKFPEMIIEHFSRRVEWGEFVHPNDIGRITPILHGSGSVSAEIRLRGEGKPDYLWHEVRGTVYCNRQGQALHSIGTLTDINEKKRDMELLRYRAERDPFTQLYNKVSANAAITHYLETEGVDKTHALLVIDLDNFKMVNDTYGHQFGDEVLVAVAKMLTEIFRNSDIIGRVGGDEYLVFMKEVVDPRIIREKAQAICDTFDASRIGIKENYIVSGSIGISIYPKDGNTYSELFRKADLALYTAKENGKSRFHFYVGEQDIAGRVAHLRGRRLAVAKQNSDEGTFQLLRSVLELCGRSSSSTRDVIHAVLRLAGSHYRVSRAYLMVDAPQTAVYEWCAANVPRRGDSFVFSLPYEQRGDYSRRFDPVTTAMRCDDTEELRELYPAFYQFVCRHGIKAVLQVKVGYRHGYIGFEDCVSARVWDMSEIGVLGVIGKMLDNFLTQELFL